MEAKTIIPNCNSFFLIRRPETGVIISVFAPYPPAFPRSTSSIDSDAEANKAGVVTGDSTQVDKYCTSGIVGIRAGIILR